METSAKPTFFLNFSRDTKNKPHCNDSDRHAYAPKRRNRDQQNPRRGLCLLSSGPTGSQESFDDLNALSSLLSSIGIDGRTKIPQRRSNIALTAPSTPRSSRDEQKSPVYQRARASSLSHQSKLSAISTPSSHSSDISVESLPARLLSHPGLETLSIEDYVDADNIMLESSGSSDIFELGGGAQGRIFKAQIGGETVAVKVSDDECILREYCLMRQFDENPNILRPIAFSAMVDEAPSTCAPPMSPRTVLLALPPFSKHAATEPTRIIYMACYEYCENGDLASYLAKHQRRRTDHRFLTKIFSNILSALAHIHDLGYIHGDIKPENILVMDDETVKLADFGMCQKIGDCMFPQGTPSYLAPEMVATWFTQLGTDNRYTAAADIFSLGVTLTHIISGKYPYRRITARLRCVEQDFTEAEIQHIFETPKRLIREIEVFLPKFAVLAKLCLRIVPDERPSASDLREILLSLLPTAILDHEVSLPPRAAIFVANLFEPF